MTFLDALADEAWTADEVRLRELWAQARGHPELADSARLVEFVRRKGYETATHLFRDRLEWAALALAQRGDPRVLPFVVRRAERHWDFARLLCAWVEAGRTDPRLAAAVRPWLEPDRGVHSWKDAARCLAYVGTPADAETIALRLGACFDAMWSPDASQTVRMEQHVASLGASLARLGVPASAAPMLEAVARVEGRSIDRGRGTAAWLLSLLGTGLPSIVQGLRWALTQQHPQFAPGQIWALGRLGRGGSAAERRGLVELVRQVVAAADSDSSATLTLAGQAALSDLGEPVELPGAAAHALERCDRYSWSSCLELLLLALELVGSRDDLPASLALPFVGDEEPRLHRAARRALSSRGATVPSFEVLDAATLAELPVPELEARLARPFAPRETLGLQLAASPSPALTPWLLAQWPRLPAPRHRDDPRSDARSAWLRALAASHEPEALALTRQVVTDEPGLLALEHWPEELADLVARQFLHGANPRQREGAREWIAQRLAVPRVVAVLDDLGLAPEDFTRRHR